MSGGVAHQQGKNVVAWWYMCRKLIWRSFFFSTMISVSVNSYACTWQIKIEELMFPQILLALSCFRLATLRGAPLQETLIKGSLHRHFKWALQAQDRPRNDTYIEQAFKKGSSHLCEVMDPQDVRQPVAGFAEGLAGRLCHIAPHAAAISLPPANVVSSLHSYECLTQPTSGRPRVTVRPNLITASSAVICLRSCWKHLPYCHTCRRRLPFPSQHFQQPAHPHALCALCHGAEQPDRTPPHCSTGVLCVPVLSQCRGHADCASGWRSQPVLPVTTGLLFYSWPSCDVAWAQISRIQQVCAQSKEPRGLGGVSCT